MAFFSKSLRNWTKKHDFIEGLTEWSPTEYAELRIYCWVFSHRIRRMHRIYCWVFSHRIRRTHRIYCWVFSHRIRRIHRTYCWVFSHRIRRTHRIYCWVFSHRFHRNTQNLLLSILPQISDAILGGALVSARLCRLTEQEVHQPSKQWSSHRFHSKFAEECDAVA